MKKFLSLVRNDFRNDARVKKTALSYKKFGFKPIVVAQKGYKGLNRIENGVISVIRIPLFSSLYSTNDSKLKKKSTININKNTQKPNVIYKALKNNSLRLILVDVINSLIYNLGAIFLGIKFKPDIVYANDLDTLSAGFAIKLITRAKLVYDSHEIWLEASTYLRSMNYKKFLWRLLEKKLITKSDAISVTTRLRAEYLEKKYNLEKIYVVQNCPPFKPDLNKRNILRNEFKILPNMKILIYQGLMTAPRGIFDIIHAIKELKNVVVVFMGMGKAVHELYDYVQKIGLDDRVFFKDPVKPEEVIDVVSSADIGLQPFHYTFNHYSVVSNKLFECLMGGISVIGSNFPEMIRVIEKCDFGYTFQSGNVIDLKSKIELLVNNQEVLKKFKENALKHRIRFTWENEEAVIAEIVKVLINE